MFTSWLVYAQFCARTDIVGDGVISLMLAGRRFMVPPIFGWD